MCYDCLSYPVGKSRVADVAEARQGRCDQCSDRADHRLLLTSIANRITRVMMRGVDKFYFITSCSRQHGWTGPAPAAATGGNEAVDIRSCRESVGRDVRDKEP